MPEINITRGYADGEALLEVDLDNIKTAVTDLNNTTKYDGENLQSEIITTAKIVNDSITTTTLATGCVTTHKINDLGVTTAKILDGTISARNIDDSSITTAKLADSSVTNAKFSTSARLSANKIEAKLVSTAQNASATTVNYGDPITTIATITLASARRFSLIMLQPYDSSSSYIELVKDSGTTGCLYATIGLYINGVLATSRNFSLSDSSTYMHYLRIPLSSISFLDTSVRSAGVTIALRLSLTNAGSGSPTGYAKVTACTLYDVEL